MLTLQETMLQSTMPVTTSEEACPTLTQPLAELLADRDLLCKYIQELDLNAMAELERSAQAWHATCMRLLAHGIGTQPDYEHSFLYESIVQDREETRHCIALLEASIARHKASETLFKPVKKGSQ